MQPEPGSSLRLRWETRPSVWVYVSVGVSQGAGTLSGSGSLLRVVALCRGQERQFSGNDSARLRPVSISASEGRGDDLRAGLAVSGARWAKLGRGQALAACGKRRARPRLQPDPGKDLPAAGRESAFVCCRRACQKARAVGLRWRPSSGGGKAP